MINLRRLSLNGNQISDITHLRRLTSLEMLYLVKNKIKDISPLANLRHLRLLYLGNNKIQDISALEFLTSIGTITKYGASHLGEYESEAPMDKGIRIHLGFANNQISDITPLVNNPRIGAGDGIDLRGNPLNDEAYNLYIPALIERGVNVLCDPKT